MGTLALVAVFAVQAGVGALRARIPGAERWTDNEPLVLMRDGVADHDAMRRARVTEDDLRQKLRLAGLSRAEEAALVVMETTGDVSVLRDRPSGELSAEIRGA